MKDKKIIITERDGLYSLENNGLSDFALIGILECILLDLKFAHRRAEIPTLQKAAVEAETPPPENTLIETPPVESLPEPQSEEINPIPKEFPPDIRDRIKKATAAIRGLGGEVENLDLSKMSDEELRTEFDELTNQYKRLKTSQSNKKAK